MPTHKFPFKIGGPKRMEVSRPMLSNTFTVKVDGKTLFQFPGGELKRGVNHETRSGTRIHISHKSSFTANGFDVRINGKSLPGSVSHPLYRVTIAYQAIYFVAAVNLIIGVLNALKMNPLPTLVGAGITPVIVGGIYLFLAFFVQGKSRIALGIAIIGFTIDSVLLVVSIFSGLGLNSASIGGFTGGMFVRVFFLIYMVQGFMALNEIYAEEKRSAQKRAA